MGGGPCTPSFVSLPQERRRAERAEQQRFRTEKERERQAKLAVGASFPWEPECDCFSRMLHFPFMIFSVIPRKSSCFIIQGSFCWKGQKAQPKLDSSDRKFYWLI